ncbi:hypothetical protein RHMOL_Rhmol07G0166900 [Rhododendron molle]|uniref:Uncharacterized protein n=1 Tax=Rhododendron molle TaxID=49168 RepID=A0ACC0N1E0_RHOML|nr:hypothetical protein RHMOL_Rhmol07G0166900 [Rhododendron molle]
MLIPVWPGLNFWYILGIISSPSWFFSLLAMDFFKKTSGFVFIFLILTLVLLWFAGNFVLLMLYFSLRRNPNTDSLFLGYQRAGKTFGYALLYFGNVGLYYLSEKSVASILTFLFLAFYSVCTLFCIQPCTDFGTIEFLLSASLNQTLSLFGLRSSYSWFVIIACIVIAGIRYHLEPVHPPGPRLEATTDEGQLDSRELLPITSKKEDPPLPRILLLPDGPDSPEAEVLLSDSPDSPEFAFWLPDGPDSEEGPGIEDFQIIGEAKPGYRLQGCGFPVRGTPLCMFQWVRHLQDGTRHYIEGATEPEYVVTADDVDKLRENYPQAVWAKKYHQFHGLKFRNYQDMAPGSNITNTWKTLSRVWSGGNSSVLPSLSRLLPTLSHPTADVVSQLSPSPPFESSTPETLPSIVQVSNIAIAIAIGSSSS